MAYGERIKHYRVLRNMSQEEISELTGITYTSISRIEHDTRKVTLEEAVRFADVFNITLHDLAGIPDSSGQQEEVKILAHQCAQKALEAKAALDEVSTLAHNLDRTLALS